MTVNPGKEKGSNFRNYYIKIFEIFSFIKIQSIQKMGKYDICTRNKEIDKKTISEEAQIRDELDRDFKSTILNMLKELKETMGNN